MIEAATAAGVAIAGVSAYGLTPSPRGRMPARDAPGTLTP